MSVIAIAPVESHKSAVGISISLGKSNFVFMSWFGLVWLFGEFGEFAVGFTLCAFHQDKQSLLVDVRHVGAIDCNKCGIKFGS
jgi:hypothetical protein